MRGGEQFPAVRVRVGAVQNGFKMEMTSRGGSSGADPGNDLADTHRIALLNGYGLKVVVGGDEPVAMVDLHPVPAAPGVPADGPHHAGVGRIDPGAAGSGVVLAPVEFAGVTSQRARAQTVGGRLTKRFQRRHEPAQRRTFQAGGGDIQLPASALLGARLNRGAAKANQRRGVRGESDGGLCCVAGDGRAGRNRGAQWHGRNGTGNGCRIWRKLRHAACQPVNPEGQDREGQAEAAG
ncbi:hypothetical protein ACVWZ8_000988 [Arthrobacter sp. UYCu723]